MNRRQLLEAVGSTGDHRLLQDTMRALDLPSAAPPGQPAGYHAPRRADFALSGRTAPSVVVLGAGVAGLAAAYELGKGGYDCLVLEAKSRVGGRVWTVRGGDVEQEIGGPAQHAPFTAGQYFEAGAARINQSMVTIDYCRELGIDLEPFIAQNADGYIHHQHSAEHSPARPIRYRTARADVYGYVSELLGTVVAEGVLDHRLTAADKASLLEFLAEFGEISDHEDWSYRGGTRRGLSVPWGAGGQDGVPLGPPPSLSEVFGSAVGRRLTLDLDHEKAATLLAPTGGMDAVTSALAAAVGPERVRLRSVVTELASLDDGVRVTYQDADGHAHVVTADYCVAAVPPHLMARIAHNLGRSVTEALAFPRPRPAFKIGVEYRRRWWELEDRVYGGTSETDTELQHIWYPSHGFHGERGVLVGYSVKDAAARLGELGPQARLRRFEQISGDLHEGGDHRADAAGAFSVAWHRIPHIEGAWSVWPSFTSGEYGLLGRPAGRVYFAGDWLSHLIAWQAGAFESARLAVSAIHRRTLAAPASAPRPDRVPHHRARS